MKKSTHIGSLPFDSIDEAIKFNQKFDLPVLSSLPKLDNNEFMLQHISQGIVGATIIDFKIHFEHFIPIDDFRIQFQMENDFINAFSNQSIKWQFIGPITFLSLIKKVLDKDEEGQILNWYFKLINQYHLFLKNHFSKVLFFVDEPLLINHFMYKNHLLYEHFEIPKIELGIHFCCKVKLAEINFSAFSYISLDCFLYGKEELIYLNELKKSVLWGVVSSDEKGQQYSIDSLPLVNNSILTPTCGLSLISKEQAWNTLKQLQALLI